MQPTLFSDDCAVMVNRLVAERLCVDRVQHDVYQFACGGLIALFEQCSLADKVAFPVEGELESGLKRVDIGIQVVPEVSSLRSSKIASLTPALARW